MDNIIGSQGLFTDGYAVSAVRALSKKSSLTQVLKGQENASNLFGSRSSLDGMMKGLVEFRRRGLINDGEYIKLQVSLVERLDGVNRE